MDSRPFHWSSCAWSHHLGVPGRCAGHAEILLPREGRYCPTLDFDEHSDSSLCVYASFALLPPLNGLVAPSLGGMALRANWASAGGGNDGRGSDRIRHRLP